MVGPLLVEGLNRPIDFFDHEWSQPQGGFVEQQQARLGHERPGDGKHLLLAAAQGSGLLTLPVVENGEALEHAFQGFGNMLAAKEIAAEFEVFEHRQVREELPRFGHLNETQPYNALRRQVLDRRSAELDRSFRGLEQSAHHPQQGAFAGAVGPDQGDNFPLCHVKRHAPQNLNGTVTGRQSFNL